MNVELNAKVDEIGDANSDLHRLMGASAIPTVFLDSDLRVTMYTPVGAGPLPLHPLRHRASRWRT